MKESDLFEPAKQFLLNTMNCEKVYAEVVDLDVVGKHGSVYIGIEMKTSLNFKVIEQAVGRKHLVDYMFILVPKPKTRHASIIMDWLKSIGIGLLYYDTNVNAQYHGSSINVEQWGKRQRNSYSIERYINETLDSINIGGVKGGETITRYKNTIDKIKHCLYFEKNGLTIKELLDRVETHYTNPKPSTAATLRAHWNLEWCEHVEREEDGEWVYRMKEECREPYWNEYKELSSELRALRRGI